MLFRRTRSVGALLARVLALAASFTPVTANAGHDAPRRTAKEHVAAMQPGWNLGNTLDSTGSDETSWGNPRITEALLDNVKAQGFKSIRLPVTWSAHLGAAPDHVIEAAYLNRVKEVIRWALARDLYVMVNIHHDSWQWILNMPSEHDGVLSRYNAIWTQLAAAFKEFGPKLTFESVERAAVHR